ncbi:MAG: aspartate aminotransferase family protein [Marinifilaceae bacterium]
MGLFEVYPLLPITPVRAKGNYIYNEDGASYLDFYGGHAVISIGHGHPHYKNMLNNQLEHIGFYSNAVHNPLQVELAEKLEKLSGCEGYNLFLCNSGAEANENAMKLASFVTGRAKVVAMKGAFHGRTSAAVAATDNPKIQAPINQGHGVDFVELNDIAALTDVLSTKEYAAVLIEGIQGVGGIYAPTSTYLQQVRTLCNETGTLLIMDEVQSGCGRTGKFFAYQHSGIEADVVTMAKGMGNGFPVAGILIAPHIEAVKGMLGTTFGGSHLACAASLAVVEVMDREYLINNAAALGGYLIDELQKIEGVAEVRGKGLMIGVDVPGKLQQVRGALMNDYHILTGYSGTDTLRLLPPLVITRKEADQFLDAFKSIMLTYGEN